jgi:flagellar protein FliO/FliZ
MKRFLYKNGGKNSGRLDIKVLSTQLIMPKKFLSIVKVQEKYFLLGISENSVNLIDKLDDFVENNFDETNVNKKGFNFFYHLKNNMIGK